MEEECEKKEEAEGMELERVEAEDEERRKRRM